MLLKKGSSWNSASFKNVDCNLDITICNSPHWTRGNI